MKEQKNILFIFLLLFFFGNTYGQTTNIQLSIQNIRGTDGQLVIGLFDSAEDFKAKANPYQAAKVKIADSTVLFTFSSIPNGNYAIAVFHDENSDGRVNTGSMKIPLEGVGISGKMHKMRAPKFEDAVFRLENDTSMIILLMYPSQK